MTKNEFKEIEKEYYSSLKIERITSPKNMNDLIKKIMKEKEIDETLEHFFIIGLNSKSLVVYRDTIATGGQSAVIVDGRKVFKEMLLHSCNKFIVGHNHPSGDTTPSNEDIVITKELIKGGNYLNIKLIDHIIVGENTFLSMREQKKADFT